QCAVRKGIQFDSSQLIRAIRRSRSKVDDRENVICGVVTDKVILARPRKYCGVAPGPAVHVVVAGVATNLVISVAAKHIIVAIAAAEPVVAVLTVNRVITATAVDRVGTVA